MEMRGARLPGEGPKRLTETALCLGMEDLDGLVGFLKEARRASGRTGVPARSMRLGGEDGPVLEVAVRAARDEGEAGS